MPNEPLIIELDQGPPTEPGWYFCQNKDGPSLPAARYLLKHDGRMGVANEHAGTVRWVTDQELTRARWSRRIEFTQPKDTAPLAQHCRDLLREVERLRGDMQAAITELSQEAQQIEDKYNEPSTGGVGTATPRRDCEDEASSNVAQGPLRTAHSARERTGSNGGHSTNDSRNGSGGRRSA